MTTLSQAVANKLNILESAIIEIQEWAKVLWVRFQGGCRFVSKKIKGAVKMEYEVTELLPNLDAVSLRRYWKPEYMEFAIALAAEIKGKTDNTSGAHEWWCAQFPAYKMASDAIPCDRSLLYVQDAAIAINKK
jgi:hypothetical protein